jgi:hypothetical protein
MEDDHQVLLEAIHGIDNRLVELETKQELRHQENQKDVAGIGGLTRSVDKHCHEIGKLKVHRSVHWVMLGAIAVAVILT